MQSQIQTLEQTLKICHISDLHCGKKSFHESINPNTRHSLGSPVVGLKNFLTNLEPIDKPDFLVITGDLTFRASQEEFNQAFKCIGSLVNTDCLKNHDDCLENRVIIVPGNHDIVWNNNGRNDRYKQFCKYFPNGKGYITPWTKKKEDERIVIVSNASNKIIPTVVCLYPKLGIGFQLIITAFYSGVIPPEYVNLIERLSDAPSLEDVKNAFLNEIQRDHPEIKDNYLEDILKDARYVKKNHPKLSPLIGVLHHPLHYMGYPIPMGADNLLRDLKDLHLFYLSGHIHDSRATKTNLDANPTIVAGSLSAKGCAHYFNEIAVKFNKNQLWNADIEAKSYLAEENAHGSYFPYNRKQTIYLDRKKILAIAESCILMREHTEAERLLLKLYEFAREDVDTLWALHYFYFERLCHAKDRNDLKTKCMKFLVEAARVRPRCIDEMPYKIIKPIGYGGLSYVYLVEKDGECYAAKVLKKEILNNSDMFSVFQNNIKNIIDISNLAKAQKKPLCEVIEYNYIYPNDFVIIMEYIKGKSLESIIHESNTRKSPAGYCSEKSRWFLRIIEKVCDGLEYSHEKKLIHLDIKPSNILIRDKDDEVFIIDFDCSRLAITSYDLSGSYRFVFGTQDYIAPEIQKNPKLNDTRSDLFSLGMTMKKIFCGEVKTSAIASQVNKSVSPLVDELIDSAIEDNPENRIQSASVFKSVIKLILGETKDPYRKRTYFSLLFTTILLSFYAGALIKRGIPSSVEELLYILPSLVGILSIFTLAFIIFADRILGINMILYSNGQKTPTYDILFIFFIAILSTAIAVLTGLYPENFLLFLSIGLFFIGLRIFTLSIKVQKATKAKSLLFVEGMSAMAYSVIFVLPGYLAIRHIPVMLQILFDIGPVFFSISFSLQRQKKWETILGSISRSIKWANFDKN